MTEESATKESTVKEEKTSGVTADMKAAAAADLKVKQEQRDSGGVRTFTRGYTPSKLYVSEIFEFPKEFDLSGIAPTSYLAQPEGDITGNLETQKFSILEKRLEGLTFDVPGRPLERGRSLRTVKWLKPTGVLAQVPFEPQVNNQAAGDEGDAIGIRKVHRKGGVVFFNFETGLPVYCFANNCWAAAMVPELAKAYPQHVNVVGSGYCSRDHFMFVETSRARKFFNEGGGMFETGVTTSRNVRA